MSLLIKKLPSTRLLVSQLFRFGGISKGADTSPLTNNQTKYHCRIE